MIEYVTVFDASDEPLKGAWFILPGIILTTVGGLLLFRPSLFDNFLTRGWTRWPIFNWIFFLFAAFWTVAVTFILIDRAVYASTAIQDGECQVVEGRIENFQPMPKEGHETERFEVDGVKFQYSDYRMSAGFNNTASHGGPMREGLRVRICHDNGTILKLETER